MRVLLITASAFFVCFTGVLAFFAESGPKQDFDLKYVLPVDTRQMPDPPALPEVAPLGGKPAEASVTNGSARTGSPPVLPARPPVQFGQRDGAASEAAH